MFLLLLLACFEHTAQRVDATVNLRARTADVQATWEDVRLDDEVTTAAEAVEGLRKELASVRQFGEGATASDAHFALTDGRLDLLAHYSAPLAFFEQERGLPLRAGWSSSVAQWGAAKPGRPALFVWVEADEDTRPVLSAAGPWRIVQLKGDKEGDFVAVAAIDHGQGTIHLESREVGEGGAPLPPSGWVAGITGLAEALREAGLLDGA
jgi:hypothetical protein